MQMELLLDKFQTCRFRSHFVFLLSKFVFLPFLVVAAKISNHSRAPSLNNIHCNNNKNSNTIKLS